MGVVNSGFVPRRERDKRLPPGQYRTEEFPVLALGPTPQVPKEEWQVRAFGLAQERTWNWEGINKMPVVEVVCDIHCVTKWSKFDSKWRGVPLDEIMQAVKVRPEAKYLIAYSYDGYTTNLPIEDVRGEKAWVALSYDGREIPAEHGGPVRLLVPHLYFWKSAKWLKALEFSDHDVPGFWETRGYHSYGDPWKEQRYTDD